MKLEDVDEFKPIGTSIMYTSMEYVPQDADGNEVMYVGTLCGQIHTFLLYRRKFPRNLRAELLSRDSQHSGSVTCIIYSNNSELSTSAAGVVISGSSDRTIKIWSPITTKPFCIQTLYGHEGTITHIADGHDGTLLSCSVDGTLRMWKPQRGRKLMLHHFLECTYVMKQKNSWLSSLAVSPINIWACYVGNMEGTIEIFHKGADNNEAERKAASFTGQLTKFKCWEHVHTLGIHEIQIIYEESFLITLSFDHCCKILDLHLGTILHHITNSHNCKYMGIIWDSPNFQMYLSDENGFMEVWSSFYERKVEDMCVISWKPPKRETNSVVTGNGNTAISIAQLVTMPLISKISKLNSASDCIIALHPRRGFVTMWQISSESSTVEFHGHNGHMILGLSVLDSPVESISQTPIDLGPQTSPHRRRLTNATLYNQSTQQVSGISPEESTFFSVGEDNTVICWDEYDRTERYSFRLKESSDVVVVKTIWALHYIATGHEDGVFSLWNIDSANRVSSRSLRGNPITDIAEGKNKHNDDILIASDRSGRIAVWNLSLFRMHCLDLPLELLSRGYHHPEDPGILSLSFHKLTSCLFSGGVDGIINCWRLSVDNEPVKLRHHEGNSIWNLQLSERYLVSGDESGEVVLWYLDKAPMESETRFMNSSLFPLDITKLCCWKSAIQGSFQSLSLQQCRNHAFVAIADHTGKSTSIWYIKASPIQTGLLQPPSAQQQRRNSHDEHESNHVTRLHTPIPPKPISNNEIDERDSNHPRIALINPKISQHVDLSYARDLVILTEIFENLQSSSCQVEMELLQIIFHDSLEATSMELRVLPIHHGHNYSGTLYIGMSNGVVQKHTIREFY